MKIVRFHIKNYRSIVDLGDCYPADRVTVLAGMNEAGKSSVLEALEDFNAQTDIRDSAIPLQSDDRPEIAIEFRVTREELSALFDEENLSIGLPESVDILLRKSYPDKYELSEAVVRALGLDLPLPDRTDELRAIHDRLISPSQRAGYQLQPFSESDIGGVLARARKLKRIYSQNSGNLPIPDREELDQWLDPVIARLESFPTENQSRVDVFIQRFTASMPNFILFSSFDSILPNEISFSELATNGWIKDLRRMSDFNVDTIIGSNRGAKKTHKSELNLSLNRDFQQFWTQDASKLSVDWDGDQLQFWIEENGRFFPPELRSQGKRWHLAFYIRVTARAREGVSNVILIDEPGLYLHARAQRDILKLLEQASEKQHVIFSTHSPYLIEADKLDRVRLIQKTEARGTFVENKVHAVADKETLTPILTAIGLDLNQGIVAADRTNNVLVEGPSDYFYLTAFGLLVGKDQINFISGGGAGNMPTIGTILHGWGAKVLYLYDNDQAFKAAQRSVKRSWVSVVPKWLMSLNVEGAIEDIFERSDFATYVLNCSEADIPEKNSIHMKGRDKVLPARRFLELIRSTNSPQLSGGTIDRIHALFSDLEARFSGYYLHSAVEGHPHDT